MPVNVEQCPACGNSMPVRVARLDEVSKAAYLDYSKAKYAGFLDDWLEQIDVAIDGCSQCGHYWYKEQPDNEMLSNMYTKGRPLLAQKGIAFRNATPAIIQEIHRIKKLVSFVNPRLLDYGSGFGRWARAAVQAGFQVTAYEPSEERGIENHKIDFTLLHDVDDLKNQYFEIINLEQVLEHVPNPVALLKELRIYCTADTIIRITVPNVLRCPEGSKIWSEWPYNGSRAHTMAPFEHLHGFTPESLRKAVIRAGFKPVNNLKVWFNYPVEMLRSYIGKLFPRLGQTFILIKINQV
jgi:SAM-dependent methyltransferase